MSSERSLLFDYQVFFISIESPLPYRNAMTSRPIQPLRNYTPLKRIITYLHITIPPYG